MSEASELKAFKEKLDRKYGKIAKRRLNKLNKRVAPKLNLMDMTENEFDNFVNQLVGMINNNNQLQNNDNAEPNAQNDQNTNQNRG